MKKIYSVAAVVFVVSLVMFASILPSYAEGGDDPSIVSPLPPDADRQFQELKGEFDIELLPIEDLPSDVIPFHAQNMEEVREILQFLTDDNSTLPTAIKRELSDMGVSVLDIDSGTVDSSQIKNEAIGASPASRRDIRTRRCTRRVGLARLNVVGDFLVDRYSKRIIRVTHTRAYMSGWTWGVGLKRPYSYAYNKRAYRVSVRGGGIAQAYILLNNRWLTFYQAPVSCGFTYRSR